MKIETEKRLVIGNTRDQKLRQNMEYLTQLTILYSICAMMAEGRLAPSLKVLIAPASVNNAAPYKHFDSDTKTDSSTSNSDSFSKKLSPNPIESIKNVIDGEHKALINAKLDLLNNEDLRNDVKAFEDYRKDILLDNKMSADRNPSFDVKVGEVNGNYLRPFEQVFVQNKDKRIDNHIPEKELDKKDKLVRHRRGFRSAVADRIAHGFGKRTPLLALGDTSIRGAPNQLSESDLESLMKAFSQSGFQLEKQFLSLQPMNFDDKNSSTEEIIRKILTTRRDRFGVGADSSDGDSALSGIIQKLVNQMQDSTGETLFEDVYGQHEE